MYTREILWFVLLPVLIYISYRLVLIALRRYERNVIKSLNNKDKQ